MTRLVVTLGDPAGIGPEVTELACQRAMRELPNLEITLAGPENLAGPMAHKLGVGIKVLSQAPFVGPQGQPSAASGTAALQALDAAIASAKQGAAQAIVTAPISKQALMMAGSRDLGHTDILARALAVGPTAMAFFAPRLRVVLATVHVPLREVFAKLNTARVLEVSHLLDSVLRRYLHLAAPRIALCGLNPHAGEHGLLGDEEDVILTPAVKQAQAQGIGLSGPHAADSLFFRAAEGEFDGVVALYHDQGLIPVKLLSFGAAVNVTLGLSTVRTSPDHGTAYDKVGTGLAQPEGMFAAITTAVELVAARSE